MDLKEFANKIGLNRETLNFVLNSNEVSDSDIADFYFCPSNYIEKLKASSVDYNAAMLVFYTKLAASKGVSKYNGKGISEQVCFDTMYDLTLWSEVYKAETGKFGIADSETEWFIAHMNANIFTLGRLQFKPNTLKHDLELGRGIKFSKGDSVVEIHIPRGKAMTIESVNDSIKKAQVLFGRGKLYSCFSWLLSPYLQEVLPLESNIMSFASRFEITQVIPNDNSAMRYLRYAAMSKTSALLQWADERVKHGKQAGAALGWIYDN